MQTDFIKRRDREFEAQVAQFRANLGPVKTALDYLPTGRCNCKRTKTVRVLGQLPHAQRWRDKACRFRTCLGWIRLWQKVVIQGGHRGRPGSDTAPPR